MKRLFVLFSILGFATVGIQAQEVQQKDPLEENQEEEVIKNLGLFVYEEEPKDDEEKQNEPENRFAYDDEQKEELDEEEEKVVQS